MSWQDDARADGAWRGVRVCVAGIGVSGLAAARVLAARGAAVVAVDGRDGPVEQDRAAELAALGVTCRLGPDAVGGPPEGSELVVTSPGWRPDQPLLLAAAEAGVPVWGEVELAWRLRDPAVPWLGVTGTNGKTTTVQMLASILSAAGYRTVAAGNVGLALLDAVLADPPYDVLAVEVSSFQLHWTSTVEFRAAAILNIAPDHLDWHGSLEAYAADKARIWRGRPCVVFNEDDPLVARLAQARPDSRGFTLGPAHAGSLCVDGDVLVDGCFDPGDAAEVPGTGGVELARLADVRPPAPHNVANALAAAALARALGCDPRFRVLPAAVRDGLRDFSPGAHRIALVATLDGVDFVDDSKATNPHAAAASLAAYDPVVWIAGGLAKGARFEEVVAGAAGRLRGVVLLGQDRALVAEALARHAPDVPVREVLGTDTGAMDDVVRAAAGLARPGDTVLLAPACASMDMFANYAERGDAFAAAVRRLQP